MQRIGLLSGTFDPIHYGHVTLAQTARAQLGLDEVWILVNGSPEGKTEVAAFKHRLEMARRAVIEVNGVVADREPVQRMAQRHSIATAHQLVQDYPDHRFTLIMGIDTFSGIDSWDDHAKLLSLMDFAVAERPGSNPSAIADLQRRLGAVASRLNYRLIAMPPLSVSSRQAKDSLRTGAPATDIPSAVQQYISYYQLYTAASNPVRRFQ
ncbi:MAG TPA: nicotinate (nicotinamide) nucleotide adenylyltransferase [Candidatus Saccharimonadales bacterium]|nr:nicotinate (nicotinamide) nucleotide adenylyltransferase [Candidatus Saccharimonadales bacterium]